VDGGDNSGGRSQKTSSDCNSNGGVGGLKDSDGLNDDHSFSGMCDGERVSDYDGGTWDCVKAVRGAASESSNSSGAGDIDGGGSVVTDSDGVDADGAGISRRDSCGGSGWAINADDDWNRQGGLSGDNGFVRGDGDHVGERAEGSKSDGAKSNGDVDVKNVY